MGHTLFLMMYSLKTDNVTVILDCCYSGGATRGNISTRSIPTREDLLPSEEEYQEQKRLLAKTQLTPDKFREKRKKSVAKGVVLAAAQRKQLAQDGKFENFPTGTFTYNLTQHLWQQFGNEPFQESFRNISKETNQQALSGGLVQEPMLEENTQNSNSPLYFLSSTSIPAEAVITNVKNTNADLWLGGINLENLASYGPNTILTIVDSEGAKPAQVQITSRTGLSAQGKLISNERAELKLAAGMLLQERVRIIPKDFSLKIGLDNTSLSSSDITEAQQALKAIPRIQAFPLGKQEVQYIFGRITQAKYQELNQQRIPNLPPVNSYCLFLPSLNGIVANSFGKTKTDETIATAIERLRPQLISLLATKLIKQLLGNADTSQLKIEVTMLNRDNQQPLAQALTRGAKTNSRATKSTTLDTAGLKLAVGTGIFFEIENKENKPLYISIVGIDNSGAMSSIFPLGKFNVGLIEQGQKLTIPKPGEIPTLSIYEPFGFSEVLIIASTAPLNDSLSILKAISTFRGNQDNSNFQELTGDDFLNFTDSLVNDLSRTSRGENNNDNLPIPDGIKGIDTHKIATISIPFEVVNKN